MQTSSQMSGVCVCVCVCTFDDLLGTLVVDLSLGRVGRQHAVEHVRFALFTARGTASHNEQTRELNVFILEI